MDKTTKIYKIRHSLAHLLAAAALEHDPGAKLTIGPAIENGFYYDIDFSEGKAPTEKDLKNFQRAMKKLIGKGLSFEGREVTEDEARKLFADNPYKLELIDGIVKAGQKITVYQTGDQTSFFADLCEGGHVGNTSEIDAGGFKLSSLAGAYWRGDEKNKMLTRVYGLAFETGKELDDHLALIEEAKKRDHRKLGKDLGLFVFSDLVGPGLPLWTPKGTMMRELLNDSVWEQRKQKGFQKVAIPHITKKELYETSGHWQKFAEELFKIETREGHIFAMKPMNCPHHAQIFAAEPKSYRDMPARYCETTMVYRDEQSGELSGLARVLSITQDDAHVFCRENQIEQEFFAIWDIIDAFYGRFGFKNMKVRFSRHDPDTFEKYLGTKETWEKAENALLALIQKRGVKDSIDGKGEAAMYGPKIDFMASDSLGRTLQVATIQLDFNLPERFDLVCTNEKGEKERIVMIHCAVMGSIERFIATLLEHTAGNFPFWLSPIQVQVLPITDAHRDYAEGVYKILKSSGIRAELRDESETLGKKIRNGKLQKIPYLLVVGDKEMENKTVTVESRDHGQLGAVSLDELFGTLT